MPITRSKAKAGSSNSQKRKISSGEENKNVEKLKRIASDQQILEDNLDAGSVIDNEKTNNGSASSLAIRLKNGRNISLKNFTGKNITLEFSETTDTFKLSIQDREGILEDSRELLFDDSIRKDTIQIFVRSFNGKTITLEVDAFESIESVKEKIQDKEGIPLARQILTFDEKILNNNLTISHYEIQDGSTLRCHSVIQIYVTTRRTFLLGVETSFTVEKIKALIEKVDRIPMNRQTLTYNGVKLENECTLYEYNIQEKSIIWVNEEIRMFVKNLIGETFELQVKLSETVASVKAKIQEKEGTPADKQRLVFSRIQLNDERTLSCYNIVGGLTIHMVVY